ncbi:hypothetical protein G7Z17_g13633 [Cylindrodendrum hubeiense]|uniref:Uncharacterized protein n=1 Tax=Cylindrodendrum hubeiense TaxID=595255 RepID=A0A9P5GVI7_9HYPO|nr:hypothetical protein G7Z17_g13633 [Cylindrodendrum hubeiense]
MVPSPRELHLGLPLSADRRQKTKLPFSLPPSDTIETLSSFNFLFLNPTVPSSTTNPASDPTSNPTPKFDTLNLKHPMMPTRPKRLIPSLTLPHHTPVHSFTLLTLLTLLTPCSLRRMPTASSSKLLRALQSPIRESVPICAE